MTGSRPAVHFERLYQSNLDPWSLASSPYELAKYQRTLAVLGDRRFTAGLEVGCSIGVLTRMLAPRCDALLGVDVVDTPLRAARTRCAGLSHVRFQRMQVPTEWPANRFDLIVFSEVLYYLSLPDIDRCAARARAALLPGGIIVLVNWLGCTDDPTTGNDAAERFITASAGSLSITRQARYKHYRLDVVGPEFPAHQTGNRGMR
jgi:predicted TPR repeat methyltransferase